jgi:hypothetical protein
MFYVKSQGRKGLSPDEHLMTVRPHQRQVFRFDVPMVCFARVCARGFFLNLLAFTFHAFVTGLPFSSMMFC